MLLSSLSCGGATPTTHRTTTHRTTTHRTTTHRTTTHNYTQDNYTQDKKKTGDSNNIQDNKIQNNNKTGHTNYTQDKKKTGHTNNIQDNKIQDNNKTGHTNNIQDNKIQDNKTGHTNYTQDKKIQDNKTGHTNYTQDKKIQDNKTGHTNYTQDKKKTGDSNNIQDNKIQDNNKTGHTNNTQDNKTGQQITNKIQDNKKTGHTNNIQDNKTGDSNNTQDNKTEHTNYIQDNNTQDNNTQDNKKTGLSNYIQDNKTGQQMAGTATSSMCKDFQSPQRRGCSRYTGLNNGDSPGDVEPTQDIIWDPTSPTSATTGLRNTRVVEISDIVNRIAPKDVKRKGTESPLLQWIGDSAVPCTPDIPKPRFRKKSSRQSSVDDLMKLARQFDENMQQDRETSAQLNAVNENLNERANTSKPQLTETSFPGNVKDLKCPSSSDQAEAELHALFDCSTQKVSGRLSQGSSVSSRSQEIKHQPLTSTSAEPRQSELKSAGPAAHPAEEKGSRGFSANNCDDFDDDWENDDLLNDSFVLAMTQNPDQQHDTRPKTTLQSNTKTNTTQFTSVWKPTANTNSARQPSNLHSKPSSSALQELCPKPKTTNRSTFKLEPNPHFRPKMAVKTVSKPSVTFIQPQSKMSDQKSATTKTLSIPIPDKITKDQKGTPVVADISDSLWDDGDDDALFYQVCDSVERISNSQPQQVSPSSFQAKQDIAVDRQRKTPAHLPTDTSRSTSAGASANRQSPCAFVRSNSLPGSGSETVNYQGWNIPMKGANNKSRMSQSLPGSRVSLGTFNQRRDSSGTFQAGNVEMKPHPVTARAPSHHSAFKRNVSDSAAISNKVFVTSQMTLKCSAAEIERKKQEALARRRLRMQNASKP